MPSKHAIERAAQVWCAVTTEQIEMDSRLALEFARMLDEECEAAVAFGFSEARQYDTITHEDAIDNWYTRRL